MKFLAINGLLAVALASSGCASVHYKKTEVGTLSGRMIVEWMEPDRFLYRPDASRPLRFVRRDGTVIQPEKMYTDGGSIPRPFWILRNYSPWGYGPAFMVHDWLFRMQYCELPHHDDFTVDSAATIMSEVMKTLMTSPEFDYGGKTTVYLMYKAVRLPPSRILWNSRKCEPVPSDFADSWRPQATFEIDLDKK